MTSIILKSVIEKKKQLQKHKKNQTLKKGKLRSCRICNLKTAKIPIFNNMKQPNIPEDIQTFSGVSISISDTLSKYMCQSCLDLLNGCIKFREMCQKNNKNFIEIPVKEEHNRINDDQSYDDFDDETKDEDYKPEISKMDDCDNIPSSKFNEDDLWTCYVCCKEFIDVKSYNDHLPKCDISTTEFKPPEGNPKKKFLCDICGQTACSNTKLQMHMGTHENVFPHKCDVCPYRGRTMDLLKLHKRTHVTEKLFKCPHCPKSTTASSYLAKHIKHVHNATKPFKCNYCEKTFSYQHNMKRHIQDIHLRKGTVECDVCYKKFSTKKFLQEHRWNTHKIKGRLPSYLQCQLGEQNEEQINDGDTNFQDMQL